MVNKKTVPPLNSQLKHLGNPKVFLWSSVFAAFVLFIAAASVSYYFYRVNSQRLAASESASPAAKIAAILSDVGTHMVLPTNEMPQIATVADSTKLAKNAFFSKAKNGDSVLIYEKNREAILYRSSIDKIIEVAPVDVSNSPAIASPTGSPTSTPIPEKLTVAIYNGTSVNGLASSIEKQITDKIPNLIVTVKQNANAKYTSSLIIDLTGKNKDTVKILAQTVGGQVAGTLPTTETKPDTDILIILGNK